MSMFRKWLNPTTSYDNGWIKWGVNTDSDGDRNSTLIIADCSRQISLSVHTYSKKDRKKTMRKLQTLHDAIGDLMHQIREIDEA